MIEAFPMLQNIIATQINCSLFWKDRNSQYLGCNEYNARAAGLKSPEEIVGLTDLDMPWKKTEASFYRSIDHKVWKENKKLTLQETQLRSDGQTVHLITSKAPLLNTENKIIGIFGLSQEIYIPTVDLFLPPSEFSPAIHKLIETMNLSMREAQCLHYLAKGKTYKGIAKTMGLSINTIKNYIINLKYKLKVYYRTELIELALGE